MTRNNIPKGWKVSEVKELCNIIAGSTPKTAKLEYWNGNIPWISPKDLSKYKGKYISKTAKGITKVGYNSCSTTMIKPNSVLMSSRAPIGYLVINKVPICTNQGFKSFEINKEDKLNPEYLYYYLKSIVDELKESGSGTTFNEISKAKAGDIKIIYPESKTLQQKIVLEIEKQFSRLDESEKELKSVKDKLSLYKKSVLKDAFEMKEGWEEKEVEEVIENIPPTFKIKKSNTLREGNIPVVDQGAGLIAGYMNNKNKIQKCELPIIIFGDHTRTFKFINFTFVCGADGTKILKPLNFIDEKFFYYQCKILKFPDKGYSRHFQYLKKVLFTFPKSKSLQQKIVQGIEQKFSIISNVEKEVDNSLNKIEKLRKSVLKSAFEGELVK